MDKKAIDWSMFEGASENTCYCKCGAIFRSHAKYAKEVKSIVARKPCPVCEKNDACWRIKTDPEGMTIG